MSSVSTATTPNYACSYVSESPKVNDSLHLFNANSTKIIDNSIQFLFDDLVTTKQKLDKVKAEGGQTEELNNLKEIAYLGYISMFNNRDRAGKDGVIEKISCVRQVDKYKKMSAENAELAVTVINHIASSIKKAVDAAAAGSNENTKKIRASLTEIAAYKLDVKNANDILTLQDRIKKLYNTMAESIFAKFVAGYEKLDIDSL